MPDSRDLLDEQLMVVVNETHNVCVTDLKRCLQLVTQEQKISSLKRVIHPMTKRNAIIIATQMGRVDLIECMLENLSETQIFVLLKLQDKERQTAIHNSVYHLDILLLLRKKTNSTQWADLLMIKDQADLTPMNLASWGTSKAVELLFEPVSDIAKRVELLQMKGQVSDTVLNELAYKGRIEEIKNLLTPIPTNQWLNLINIQDRRGENVIYKAGSGSAAAGGHNNIINFLLCDLRPDQRMFLLKAQNIHGNTALHLATRDILHTKCIMELLTPTQRKELLSITNKEKVTALDKALASNKPKLAKYLQDCDEQVEESGVNGEQDDQGSFESTSELDSHKVDDGLQDSQLLGEGHYGKVYLYYDSQAKRMVAVKKVYLSSLDFPKAEKVIAAIKNEVSLMEKFNHRRIVQYVRFERKPDEFCIYMEYMPGGSVENKIVKGGRLSEATTKKYTKQILEGLSYLHSKCIIHRDVKGSNILCDGEGGIKLADFGVSKQMDDIRTLTGETSKHTASKGTTNWMSPQVIKAETYGRKADIWSTGATIVEMLTSHPPWHGLGPFQVMYKVGTLMKAKYVLDPNISSDAENFLAQSFAPEEENRPTAEELLQHSWLKNAD